MRKIAFWDTSLPGVRREAIGIELAEEREMRVRDLIRARVEAEVARYNAKRGDAEQGNVFVGLVQPEESEQLLNGYWMRKNREVDPEQQVARALASFERNGFLVLLNGRQVESLDEIVDGGEEAEVEFLKLVPLVGG